MAKIEFLAEIICKANNEKTSDVLISLDEQTAHMIAKYSIDHNLNNNQEFTILSMLIKETDKKLFPQLVEMDNPQVTSTLVNPLVYKMKLTKIDGDNLIKFSGRINLRNAKIIIEDDSIICENVEVMLIPD